jgi:hypothetical protein
MYKPAFLFFGLLMATCLHAIRFDLIAKPFQSGEKKCLQQWVPRSTLVMVTVKTVEKPNQRADVHVFDLSEHSNEYGKKLDVTETKIAFTTQAHADISVCIFNHLADGVTPNDSYLRSFEVHIDVGADAVDYAAMAKAEKLQPLEVELRRLEQMTNEVLEELEFLKLREEQLRDTNESTHDRVKWFNIVTLLSLVALGVYQIAYLRHFFQQKKLI